MLRRDTPLRRRVEPVETFLKRQLRQWKYRTERRLINGNLRNNNPHTSIIHFSFNKSATQYVKSILRRCAIANGMLHARIHEYAFHADLPYLDSLTSREMEKYRHLFQQRGCLYSAFGGMIEGIPELDKYKVVLVARDPRDILVSAYYSIAYSHPLPDSQGTKHTEFVQMRHEARNCSIDEFVLAHGDQELDIFLRYERLLLNCHPHLHYTTYEKMVLDFPSWLDALLDYCELTISPALRRALLDENERKQPHSENVHKHVRRGRPGDYADKLQPETIEALTQKFSSIFEAFGYRQHGNRHPNIPIETSV